MALVMATAKAMVTVMARALAMAKAMVTKIGKVTVAMRATGRQG